LLLVSTRRKWIRLNKSTHLQLRTTANLQKAIGSNYWNSNNYRTVSCSNYWNLTCKTRNLCNRNRKQLQNLSPLLKKNVFKTHSSIEKTCLHITEHQLPLLRSKNELWELRAIKTAQLTLIFVGNGPHAHKSLCLPRRHYTSSFDWKWKFARIVQSAGLFGAGPDWKRLFQSAKGRPCPGGLANPRLRTAVLFESFGSHICKCCNHSSGVALKRAIHHERNVCEEEHHIYVARTSNNRVIPMEWCWWVTSNNACEPGEQLIVRANGDDESDLVGWSLLLLAATVRSFAHRPLGFPIATQVMSLLQKGVGTRVPTLKRCGNAVPTRSHPTTPLLGCELCSLKPFQRLRFHYYEHWQFLHFGKEHLVKVVVHIRAAALSIHGTKVRNKLKTQSSQTCCCWALVAESETKWPTPTPILVFKILRLWSFQILRFPLQTPTPYNSMNEVYLSRVKHGKEAS